MEDASKRGKWVRWFLDETGGLVIRQRGGLGIRLFGLLFLAGASYMLFQLIDGLLGHDLTIAGGIVLPVMAAAFLFPGLVLTFGAKYSVVDGAKRALFEVRSYGFMNRKTSTSIPEGARVVVRHETRRTTASGSFEDRAHLYCPVELSFGADRNLALAEFDSGEEAAAMALAQDAAALLGAQVLGLRERPGGKVDEAGSEDAD